MKATIDHRFEQLAAAPQPTQSSKDRVTSRLRGREDSTRSGIAPNELTSLADRDKFAGTPHHKYVPARIEAA